jgi:hypothetical protein
MSMHSVSLRNSVRLVPGLAHLYCFKCQDVYSGTRSELLGISHSTLLHHALVLYIHILN